MISQDEICTISARFGTPVAQVVRDHLISHVIAALAELPANLRDSITFFGGTALCRTWLPGLRLSEDIDLLSDSTELDEITRLVSRKLRRQFPNHVWAATGSANDVVTWNLVAGDHSVSVQFVRWRPGWKRIPTTTTHVGLRYSDLPDSVELAVPTPSGFAAMKLMAWFDRQTPRDLFDLAALSDAGHIDIEATRLVKTIVGFTPNPSNLETSVPRSTATAWQAELGHQLADLATAEDCLSRVRTELERLNKED